MKSFTHGIFSEEGLALPLFLRTSIESGAVLWQNFIHERVSLLFLRLLLSTVVIGIHGK